MRGDDPVLPASATTPSTCLLCSDIKWLKACRSYTMWLVLNWVGLRRAELAALKTHDVDLEARIIQVVNSQEHRGRLIQIRPRLAPTLRWSVQDIRPLSRMATGCPVAMWHWLIVPQTPRSALQHWPFCLGRSVNSERSGRFRSSTRRRLTSPRAWASVDRRRPWMKLREAS